MQIISLNGVSIEAVYACLPENRINNFDACTTLYGDSASDIVKSVGIEYRCLASPGTSSLDLCVAAGKRLFSEHPYLKKDIGAVICVTFTPDQLMPANAIAAQSFLSLEKDILAFDINLACSGYGYGLWLAGTIAKQLGKKVLFLDGDVQSVFTSPYDRGTMPVLADAGTATIVEPNEEGNKWYFTFFTDGTNRNVLSIPSGGSKRPIKHEDLEYIEYPDGSKRRNLDIFMNGFEVFKFVAQTVSKKLLDFLDEIGKSCTDIDGFIPHQANIYMIRQLSKKIGFTNEKLWVSADKYGNSASATIPVTIASEYSRMRNFSGNTQILLSGFGAGLSISAGLIQLPNNMKVCLFTYEEKI